MNASRSWMALLAAAAVALGFSSCTYDPYYSSGSGYYSSGYGYGHGYGSSNFSTSLFVSTGDPRWGYDPYTYCYYDYRSRRYYDPYLYGYYPIGYRPPVMIGVPHPYGWRPGRGYCPPPRRVRDVIVVNYRDRAAAYRRSDYSWANQARIRSNSRIRPERQSRDYTTPSRTRPQDSRRDRSTWSTSGSQQRPESFSRERSRQYSQPQRSSDNTRQRARERRPSFYNTPVTDQSPRQTPPTQRRSAERTQPRQDAQSSYRDRARISRNREAPSGNRAAPSSESRSRSSENSRRGSRETSERGDRRALRSLGQE